ncbi:MAG: PilZ domain-containing protein [Spirochaetes bacterium]|nr:PilZ domain-containing protein [Spirochaetota bacterium]
MERRLYTRIPFNIETIIRFNDRPIQGTVLNISLHGLFIDIPEALPDRALVGVEISMDSSGSHKSLLLPGLVVRSGSGGTAVKLMELDLESYTVVRDLMMDRSITPEVIMDEFCRFIACGQDHSL